MRPPLPITPQGEIDKTEKKGGGIEAEKRGGGERREEERRGGGGGSIHQDPVSGAPGHKSLIFHPNTARAE